MSAYQKERSEEKTARMTSRVLAPSEYGGNKMRAFWDSCYADTMLAKRLNGLLMDEQEVLNSEQFDAEEDSDRKQFMTDRINERGMLVVYSIY